MANFTVSPSQLARAAGMMLPGASTLGSAGSTISDTVGIGVGLNPLDGILAELAGSLGGWLTEAGDRLNTLAYNTQLAAELYAEVEANITKSVTPSPAPPCENGRCLA